MTGAMNAGSRCFPLLCHRRIARLGAHHQHDPAAAPGPFGQRARDGKTARTNRWTEHDVLCSPQEIQESPESLLPGNEEALRVMVDGRVVNGKTRLKVLEERGLDVDDPS